MISVEVVYALPERQWLRKLTLPEGSTAGDAVRASGVLEAFGGIDPGAAKLGIFGRPSAPDAPLRDGDRVEIYRPLAADPKETRRRRAARQRRG
jgi:putative ubiquitin-RnfH superfamily antitoxin RatB of RatAB toxin-antitoxin module